MPHAAVLCPAVMPRIADAAGLQSVLERRDLYYTLVGGPLAQDGPLLSWAFERTAHEMLCTAERPDLRYFALARASPPMVDRYERNTRSGGSDYPRANRTLCQYGTMGDFFKRPVLGEYYVLAHANSRGFNSFMVTEDTVDIFNMSLSDEHAIDSPDGDGYRMLEEILSECSERAWRYFLVVPRSRTKTSRCTAVTSVTENWASKVESFHVMRID